MPTSTTLDKQFTALIIKKSNQNNNNKDFRVNRTRVTDLLRFLCKNNPDWINKGITIDEDQLNSLPED